MKKDIWTEFARSFVVEDVLAEVEPVRALIVFTMMALIGVFLGIQYWYCVISFAGMGAIGFICSWLVLRQKPINVRMLAKSQACDLAGYSGAMVVAASLITGPWRTIALVVYFASLVGKWAREYAFSTISCTVLMVAPFIYALTFGIRDALELITLLLAAVFYWQMALGTENQRKTDRKLEVKDEVLRRVIEASFDQVKIGHMAPAMMGEVRKVLVPAFESVERLREMVFRGRVEQYEVETLEGKLRQAMELLRDSMGFLRSSGAVSFRLSDISDLEIYMDDFTMRKASFVFPPVEVVGTKEILILVLRNLSKNSFENGARIVRCEVESETDTTIRLSFRDNGHGIDKHIIPRLFMRSAGKTKGKGIGLWLCNKLLTACNGSIDLISTNPFGVSFGLTFQKSKPN